MRCRSRPNGWSTVTGWFRLTFKATPAKRCLGFREARRGLGATPLGSPDDPNRRQPGDPGSFSPGAEPPRSPTRPRGRGSRSPGSLSLVAWSGRGRPRQVRALSASASRALRNSTTVPAGDTAIWSASRGSDAESDFDLASTVATTAGPESSGESPGGPSDTAASKACSTGSMAPPALEACSLVTRFIRPGPTTSTWSRSPNSHAFTAKKPRTMPPRTYRRCSGTSVARSTSRPTSSTVRQFATRYVPRRTRSITLGGPPRCFWTVICSTRYPSVRGDHGVHNGSLRPRLSAAEGRGEARVAAGGGGCDASNSTHSARGDGRRGPHQVCWVVARFGHPQHRIMDCFLPSTLEERRRHSPPSKGGDGAHQDLRSQR